MMKSVLREAYVKITGLCLFSFQDILFVTAFNSNKSDKPFKATEDWHLALEADTV